VNPIINDFDVLVKLIETMAAILRMGQRHQVQRTLGLKMAAKPADEVRCTYQKQNR
jgi:hypothetical protein